MEHYILDGKEPVPVGSLMLWAQWFETADRTVAKTILKPNEISVSTVFLGLDHSFGNGRPLLFETMVFGGPNDGYMDRYSTWSEALEGHSKVVREMEVRLSGENVHHLGKRNA